MSVVAKRVLVTGGAGFLGSHLCERLLARTIAYFDRLLSKRRSAIRSYPSQPEELLKITGKRSRANSRT